MADNSTSERPPAAADQLLVDNIVRSDEVFTTEELLAPISVIPSWPERKDSLITYLAIFVIGSVAACSVIALMIQTIWPELRPADGDNWAIDMLTLALVSSLSFVMGSNSAERK